MITFKRILSTAKLVSKFELTALNHIKINTQLTHFNMYNFAFMSLFENNKSPGELNHVFKRVTKLKGHKKFKKNNNIESPKLNPNRSVQKTSLKNHRGLLKRIKIVRFILISGGTKMGQTIQVPKSRQVPFKKT
jgi:hypothetical protein